MKNLPQISPEQIKKFVEENAHKDLSIMDVAEGIGQVYIVKQKSREFDRLFWRMIATGEIRLNKHFNVVKSEKESIS